MNKFKRIFILPLVSLLITGCQNKKHYQTSEYLLTTNWTDESEAYRVLQLNDIHFSQSDIYDLHFEIMDKTIETSNANFIVLAGDCFTYADKHVVDKLFSYIDNKGIPWTFTFGNHDDQGYYPDTYIPRLLGSNKYKNVVFKNIEDDDVTGRTNFCIQIKDPKIKNTQEDKFKNVKYQLYILDSHSYNFDTGDYDFIKEDQIELFKRIATYTKDSKPEYIPSSVYMHIATPEFYFAAEKVAQGSSDVKLKLGSTDEFEGGPTPESDKHFFDAAKECGVRSISAAHDHINDSVIEYEGVNLCFGVHSTDRIYLDKNKIGGQVTIINPDDQSLTFENIYVDYETKEVRVQHENN